GRHPETGRDYTYADPALTPSTMAAFDLPVLDDRFIAGMLEEFDRIAADLGFVAVAEAAGGDRGARRAAREWSPLPEHERDRFVAALTAIDSDVGNDMFARVVFGIAATGLPDWLDLAQRWADGTLRGTPSVKFYMDAEGRRKLSRDRAVRQF